MDDSKVYEILRVEAEHFPAGTYIDGMRPAEAIAEPKDQNVIWTTAVDDAVAYAKNGLIFYKDTIRLWLTSFGLGSDGTFTSDIDFLSSLTSPEEFFHSVKQELVDMALREVKGDIREKWAIVFLVAVELQNEIPSIIGRIDMDDIMEVTKKRAGC